MTMATIPVQPPTQESKSLSPTEEFSQEKTQDVDAQEQRHQYPYLSLLEQLQLKARKCQSAADDNGEGNRSRQQWDLSDDAMLATLLHEFSIHVEQRTRQVSSAIRSLQEATNVVAVNVATVEGDWIRESGVVCMEQAVEDDEDSTSDGEDDDDDGLETEEEEDDEESTGVEKDNEKPPPKPENSKEEGGGDDDDSSADIARLEAEERAAIQNGMKALSLFYDPHSSSGTAAAASASVSEEEMGMSSDVDVIGDNCYHYPSAEEDVFNQRPLPFIVGSREFMESSCAGLGLEADGGSLGRGGRDNAGNRD